jgi:hypothetical protein
MKSIDLNPTPAKVDQFARATTDASNRMLGNDQGPPSPAETPPPRAEELEALLTAVEKLARALRNSASVVPREAVTGARSRNREEPPPLGNERPNIRPIRTSENARQPGTRRGREAEESLTSAEENVRAGRPRSGNEPLGYGERS